MEIFVDWPGLQLPSCTAKVACRLQPSTIVLSSSVFFEWPTWACNSACAVLQVRGVAALGAILNLPMIEYAVRPWHPHSGRSHWSTACEPSLQRLIALAAWSWPCIHQMSLVIATLYDAPFERKNHRKSPSMAPQAQCKGRPGRPSGGRFQGEGSKTTPKRIWNHFAPSLNPDRGSGRRLEFGELWFLLRFWCCKNRQIGKATVVLSFFSPVRDMNERSGRRDLAYTWVLQSPWSMMDLALLSACPVVHGPQRRWVCHIHPRNKWIFSKKRLQRKEAREILHSFFFWKELFLSCCFLNTSNKMDPTRELIQKRDPK